MNLYQKIVEVRKVVQGFSKDGKGYGYSYVTGNQVLSKIKDKMDELHLLLIPSTQVGEHHTHAYKTAKGKDALDFVVKGEMSYTWINGDNPEEREVVSWAYYGQQDDISKAYGSALTYSERYFLLKCLGMPTDEDDPDAKDDKAMSKADRPPRSVTKGEVKSKWIVLAGSDDGFEEWYGKKIAEGATNEAMNAVLAKKIMEKKEAEKSAE